MLLTLDAVISPGIIPRPPGRETNFSGRLKFGRISLLLPLLMLLPRPESQDAALDEEDRRDDALEPSE
jgi:hypothetical protein